MNASGDQYRDTDDGQDAVRFQQIIVEALQQRFPEMSVTADDDPMRVRFGDNHAFGLFNLRRMASDGKMSREEVQQYAAEAFEQLIAQISELPDQFPPWEEARSQLRLQVMPSEFRDQTSPAPLAFPLNEDACIAIVLDSEHTYSYVSEDQVDEWQQSIDSIYEQAMKNLEEASEGIEIQGSEGPDRFITLSAQDGYDAARILIPQLREYLEQYLGTPFFAGIPNRDFLFCWARDCSPEFQSSVRSNLQQDFHTQPYPITPQVLVASATELVSEGSGEEQ